MGPTHTKKHEREGGEGGRERERERESAATLFKRTIYLRGLCCHDIGASCFSLFFFRIQRDGARKRRAYEKEAHREAEKEIILFSSSGPLRALSSRAR